MSPSRCLESVYVGIMAAYNISPCTKGGRLSGLATLKGHGRDLLRETRSDPNCDADGTPRHKLPVACARRSDTRPTRRRTESRVVRPETPLPSRTRKDNNRDPAQPYRSEIGLPDGIRPARSGGRVLGQLGGTAQRVGIARELASVRHTERICTSAPTRVIPGARRRRLATCVWRQSTD